MVTSIPTSISVEVKVDAPGSKDEVAVTDAEKDELEEVTEDELEEANEALANRGSADVEVDELEGEAKDVKVDVEVKVEIEVEKPDAEIEVPAPAKVEDAEPDVKPAPAPAPDAPAAPVAPVVPFPAILRYRAPRDDKGKVHVPHHVYYGGAPYVGFPFRNAVKIDYEDHRMDARTEEYGQRICRALHLFGGANEVAVIVNSREIVAAFRSGYFAAMVLALQPGRIFDTILTDAVFSAVGIPEIGNGVQYACRDTSAVRRIGISKIYLAAMRYGQVARLRVDPSEIPGKVLVRAFLLSCRRSSSGDRKRRSS